MYNTILLEIANKIKLQLIKHIFLLERVTQQVYRVEE